MYSYIAYGLKIKSEFPIPEFVSAEGGDDITIRLAYSKRDAYEMEESMPSFRIGEDKAILNIDSVGTFVIRGGHEIIVIPANGVDFAFLRRYVVGNVLAILLYQRGYLVLHASAVNVGEKVLAFLGIPGAGKSSIAAALYLRGHRIFADDVTAVDLSNNSAMVFPAFPQIKLVPEIAYSLGLNAESLILLDEMEEKRGFRFSDQNMSDSMPLNRIYLMTESQSGGFERLSSQDAILELLRHSYPTRFAQPGGASHFLKCVSLVKQVPVYRLAKPESIQLLPEFANQVEKHVDL